ncbi:MAG: hypothetical protein K0M56_08095 [Kaistella sp.]|nr:hypothetical protein [Kaistella sp.]
MIRKFEKQILKKIDFPERLLDIREKFIEVGGYTCDNKTFKSAFFPTYKLNDLGGNYYTIEKLYSDYLFRLLIHKTSGTVLIFYIDVFNNEKKEPIGFRQYGEVFHEFPLDKNKYNENFGFNNFEEMKEYLQDMITLFDDFVEEYINQLKAGETP